MSLWFPGYIKVETKQKLICHQPGGNKLCSNFPSRVVSVESSDKLSRHPHSVAVRLNKAAQSRASHHCFTFPFPCKEGLADRQTSTPSCINKTKQGWGYWYFCSQYESTIYSPPPLVLACTPTWYQQRSKVMSTFTRKISAEPRGELYFYLTVLN